MEFTKEEISKITNSLPDNNEIKALTKDIIEAGESTGDFNPEEILGEMIDIDDINTEATRQAKLITERLSNFYFSEDYIKKHPYIPVKISSEMNNIRLLLKMLSADEKAQDALIKLLGLNIGNSRMFSSLTTLQSAMLNIQKQLNEIVERLEHIFLNMQKESGITFDDVEKENDNGVTAVRGSRDFVMQCQLMAGLSNDNRRITVSVESPDKRNALEVARDEIIDNKINENE